MLPLLQRGGLFLLGTGGHLLVKSVSRLLGSYLDQESNGCGSKLHHQGTTLVTVSIYQGSILGTYL